MNVFVRILTPVTNIVELQFSNVSGLAKLGGKAASPLQVEMQGGSAGSPVDVACAMEAKVQTSVTAIDASGTRRSENSENTLIVRGSFR